MNNIIDHNFISTIIDSQNQRAVLYSQIYPK